MRIGTWPAVGFGGAAALSAGGGYAMTRSYISAYRDGNPYPNLASDVYSGATLLGLVGSGAVIVRKPRLERLAVGAFLGLLAGYGASYGGAYVLGPPLIQRTFLQRGNPDAAA